MEQLAEIIVSKNPSDALLFVASMVIVMTMIIVFVTMFLLMRQYFYRLNEARKLRESQKYNELLVDCLFSEDDNFIENCQLNGRGGGRILFQSVMFLMHNFNGEFSAKIKELFYRLNLERYLEKDLKSRKWWKVSQGLRGSRTMEYPRAVEVAKKHINSSKLELRVEAQITLMALKVNDPFEFLNQLKRPFSNWARIHLYQEISRWEQKPDAASWLKSTNPGVLAFALRVMGLLNQKADPLEVEPLLFHENRGIREEVVRYAALILDKELWMKSAMKYKAEEMSVRQRLAQTAGMIADVPFSLLMNWFNWEKSTLVKIELARSLLIYGKDAGLSKGEINALGIVA
jgi:hypothetical protein